MKEQTFVIFQCRAYSGIVYETALHKVEVRSGTVHLLNISLTLKGEITRNGKSYISLGLLEIERFQEANNHSGILNLSNKSISPM